MMNKPYGASPLQRQRELDAFEEQRQAYNTAMRDYEEANQQPVANFDAGGEVRKMYLEQTGREADKEGLEYFSKLYGANIDKDELDAFRTMAGQEVINNDIRKAAAAEQAAAVAAADAVARQQATAAAAAKKVTDIAAGTAGMEAAAGSVAAGQLAALTAATTTGQYSPPDFLDTSQAAQDARRKFAEQLSGATTGTGAAATTTGQSPAEQQAAVVRQLTAQLAASGQSAADFYASGGNLPLTAAIANDLMTRSMTTGASTAEFDRYGGYAKVKALYEQGGGKLNLDNVPAATLTALAQTIAKTGVGNLELLKQTGVPLSTTGYQNMLKNGIDPASAAMYLQRYGAASPLTNLAGTNLTSTGLTGTNLTGTGSAGVTPIDYSSILTAKPLTFNTSTRKGRTGTLGQTSAATDYTSKGVGAVGDASTVAAKSTSKPLFGKKPVRRGAAGNSNNYFAYAPETLTGLAPGTVALGPIDTPLTGGKTTLKALESAPNLSPGMLGGVENAMYRTDRLGNRIYAPATKSLFGFAKGGDVDLQALLAQNNETLSDDTSEDSINTDPLGSAQKMMADFSSASQANPNVSPVRKAIKQTKSAPAKSGSAKMAYESLVKGDMGAMGTASLALKDTDSAQAQMQELARIYRLKAQASQERARGLSANTFSAPTLERASLTKNTLAKKRFNKGGEAKKPDAVEMGASLTPQQKTAEDSGFLSRLFGGSKEDPLKGMKKNAEQNPDYRAMLEYLKSRDAVPEITSGYLPRADAVFSAFNLPLVGAVGKGRIKINREIAGPDYETFLGPSTLAHEMAHATDRQLQEQAGEQSGMFSKGNRFTDAYEKMVGSGGMREGKKRTELARKLYPKFVSENRDYRALPYEIAAHGVGKYAGPTTADDAPPHVDATAATEFYILLDLARRNSGAVKKRAEGSPEEGELSQEEIDAASKPAFVTPNSGKGRKEGEISKQLKSGDAYINMAKGVTELPYDLAGAPMDMVMLARQALTGQAPAGQVGTSDYIKSKMTAAGVRPEPPADSTAKGFYTAGELLSNLTNPAGVTRSAVKGAQKTAEAATDVAKDFQEYNRQLSVPGASYAVRPTGSMTNMGNVAVDSNLDRLIARGRRGDGVEIASEAFLADGIKNFWDVKARNYFEKQFGTPDDPILEALKTRRIKGPTVENIKHFPGYIIDQLSVGKTRTREGERPEVGFVGPMAADPSQTRFFPKYPQAMEDITARYDTATGLKGDVIITEPGLSDLDYSKGLNHLGRQRQAEATETAREMLAAQGVRDELANPNIEFIARSEKDPNEVTSYSTQSKKLFEAYKKSTEKPSILSSLGLTPKAPSTNTLSQSVLTAIKKGQPVYDTTGLESPLNSLFKPERINRYLETLPERELKNVRFEDVVQGANKMFGDEDVFRALDNRIRSGKKVPDNVFLDGVSSPLLQFDKKSGFDGFAWKRLETPESTVPEGAYIGHSVGGYKLGGATYSKEKMQAFKDGRYQVYTLRDNRNRPVTTVEVQMVNEYTPVVLQIKGNGRASGNVPAENHDYLVLNFFDKYLHPAKIQEENKFLTPLLQQYKGGINATFKMP